MRALRPCGPRRGQAERVLSAPPALVREGVGGGGPVAPHHAPVSCPKHPLYSIPHPPGISDGERITTTLTRRDFAKAAVAAAVAPALAACAPPPETRPTPTSGVPAPTTPARHHAGRGTTAGAHAASARADGRDPVQYGERMTEAEMAKVQRSISGVLSTAERLRRFPLPIATEPTFVYRVPGGEREHPGQTLHLPLTELAEQVRARRLDPVELAEAYMARLERFGPALGALVTVTRERRWRRRGRRATRSPPGATGSAARHPLRRQGPDRRGRLSHQWGAQPYREQRLPDAAVVERLKAAGAVLVAKLASVELAGGFGYEQADASFTGPGRTPWNRDYWSGGSSSGPGAAVAAALVPYAIGSETWGSIFAPGRALRRHRAAAHLRPREPLGRDGALVDDGQARPHVPHGGGLRRGAGGHRRPRPARRIHPGPRPIATRRTRSSRAARASASSRGTRRARSRRCAATSRRRWRCWRLRGPGRDVTLPEYPYGAAASLIIDAEAASIFEELVSSGRVRELARRKTASADTPGRWCSPRTTCAPCGSAARGRGAGPAVRGRRIRRAGTSHLGHRVVPGGQAVRRGVDGRARRRTGDQRRGQPSRASRHRPPQRLRPR